MKVEFTNNYGSEENLIKVCAILGVSCRKDPDYKPRFFGCDAPDTGYIIEGDVTIDMLRSLAVKHLCVESLIEY